MANMEKINALKNEKIKINFAKQLDHHDKFHH